MLKDYHHCHTNIFPSGLFFLRLTYLLERGEKGGAEGEGERIASRLWAEHGAPHGTPIHNTEIMT